jgi:ABC-2 type transport system permease protein
VPIILGLFLGVTVSNTFVFAVAVIVTALCFASLGNVFSIPPTNIPANVMMISSMVRFPLVFISGIFVSLDELSGWGRAIAYISPLTYFTDIARHSIQQQGHLPVIVDLAVLLAFTVLFLVVSMRLHQKTMPRRI